MYKVKQNKCRNHNIITITYDDMNAILMGAMIESNKLELEHCFALSIDYT